MNKNILFIFMCLFTFSSAHAGIFGPSNKNDCHINYAAKAETKFATNYIAAQCNILFEEQPIKTYMNQHYHLDSIEFKEDPNTSEIRPYDPVDKKWIDNSLITKSILLLELQDRGVATPEMKSEYEAIQNQIKKEAKIWQQKRAKKAECIIKSKNLHSAKNDNAARLLIINTDCGK